MPFNDLSIVLNPQPLRWGKTPCDLVESRLSRGNYRFALLMEKGRKEQKLRPLDFESATPLADTTLAQNNDLLAVSQRVDDYSPFFESDSHRTNYTDLAFRLQMTCRAFSFAPKSAGSSKATRTPMIATTTSSSINEAAEPAGITQSISRVSQQ